MKIIPKESFFGGNKCCAVIKWENLWEELRDNVFVKFQQFKEGNKIKNFLKKMLIQFDILFPLLTKTRDPQKSFEDMLIPVLLKDEFVIQQKKHLNLDHHTMPSFLLASYEMDFKAPGLFIKIVCKIRNLFLVSSSFDSCFGEISKETISNSLYRISFPFWEVSIEQKWFSPLLKESFNYSLRPNGPSQKHLITFHVKCYSKSTTKSQLLAAKTVRKNFIEVFQQFKEKFPIKESIEKKLKNGFEINQNTSSSNLQYDEFYQDFPALKNKKVVLCSSCDEENSASKIDCYVCHQCTRLENRFLLLKKIKVQSTQGEIYKCYDTLNYAFCALKRSKKSKNHDVLFNREISALSHISQHYSSDPFFSRFFCKLIFSDQISNSFFLCEWIGNRTSLSQLDFSINQRLENLLLSLLIPVAILHDNQLIHSDINPSNILFQAASSGQNERFCLIDYGSLMKKNDTIKTWAKEDQKHLISEEQQKGNISPQNDLFSISVLIIEYYNSVSPSIYSNPALLDLLNKIKNSEFENAREVLQFLIQQIDQKIISIPLKIPPKLVF